MIALPAIGYFSAMENWGLVTFRNSYLLHNPQYSTMSDKQRVSRVIAHELAHQVPGPQQHLPFNTLLLYLLILSKFKWNNHLLLFISLDTDLKYLPE